MFLHILILPLLSGLIAQTIKFFIKANRQKWKIKNFFAYSGMPSGHSAMIISLATIIGLEESLHSPLFAFSVIFAIIIIRDALGLRRYLGQHGKTLNILVKDLKEDEFLDENYPRLLERIGHTPAQVLVGSLIGFLTSLLGFILLS
ncbi:MAG: divergent PAP2 family protein [Patescibacteria group bacterium]|nr:divergent PAP2 family protein [Patescibacteria group bacterium]